MQILIGVLVLIGLFMFGLVAFSGRELKSSEKMDQVTSKKEEGSSKKKESL